MMLSPLSLNTVVHNYGSRKCMILFLFREKIDTTLSSATFKARETMLV